METLLIAELFPEQTTANSTELLPFTSFSEKQPEFKQNYCEIMNYPTKQMLTV
ncbi:MAG: hypothetical protein WC708_06795 [Lentisphaeria bacterium]